MNKRLIIGFTTDTGEKFNYTIANPKDDLNQMTLETEVARLLEADVLAPSKGKPVSVHSAKIVTQTIETLI